jgi:hypothetical protein
VRSNRVDERVCTQPPMHFGRRRTDHPDTCPDLVRKQGPIVPSVYYGTAASARLCAWSRLRGHPRVSRRVGGEQHGRVCTGTSRCTTSCGAAHRLPDSGQSDANLIKVEVREDAAVGLVMSLRHRRLRTAWCAACQRPRGH